MAIKEEVDILLRPNGFVRRRVIEEPLGDQQEMIKRTASSFPVSINSIGKLDKKYPFYVHVQKSGAYLLAFTRLTELRLNTFWRVYGDKQEKCYPCWFKGSDDDAGRLDFGATYVWPLPKNMALWFVGMFSGPQTPQNNGLPEHSPVNLNSGKLEKAFLIAIKKTAGGLLRLPMCNIFQDASICMGNYDQGGDLVHTETIIDKMNRSIDHFRASPWNHHLKEYSKFENTRTIFTMSMDGKAPIETPDDWDKYCEKVNSAYYSDLNLINLTKANI